MNRKLVPMAAFLGVTSVALAGQGDGVIPGKVLRALERLRNRPAVELGALSVQDTFQNLHVVNAAGAEVAAIFPDIAGDGFIGVANHLGAAVPSAIRSIIQVSAEDTGQVMVMNPSGVPRFILDGNRGLLSASGDMAEVFPANDTVPAGSVMVIDASHPGSLQPSSQPYDRRVAGVVSGANDYNPGITLKASGTREGQVPVTLSGTVYCLASSLNGPIHAGDLLTTSSVPGHAMRATDLDASRGAILGKAMQDLKGDQGLIMVLASLQ